MQNLMPSLLVIAGTAIIIIAILWIVQRNKVQQEQFIQGIASLRGWEYERIQQRLTAGYRLRGTIQSTPWILEAITKRPDHEADSGSVEAANTTRWLATPSHLPEALVAIGPRSPGSSAVLASPLGRSLAQAALSLMVGEDAAQVSRLHEVQVGSTGFQRRYMVWADTEADAQRLVSASVESALLAWPVKLPLVVKLGPMGMEIFLSNRKVSSSIEIENIVDLGRRLLTSWQSGNE